MSDEKINRREFIREMPVKFGIEASILLAYTDIIKSIHFLGQKISSQKVPIHTNIDNNKKSILTVVTDYNSVNSTSQIKKDRIKKMFENGLITLTNKSSVNDGWQEIFPQLKTNDVIGIKINTLNPKLPTHPEVTYAVVKSLIQFGVNPNNIIIWERIDKGIVEGMVNSGYTMNHSNEGVRCIAINSKGIGFDKHAIININSAKCKFPLTKIITKMCDYMINIPVLKDHAIAGVTMCMKNFYGAIPLWNKFALLDIRRMHKNHAKTQIVELYNTPLIKEKVKLNVCDALIGCYDGGPLGRPQWINHQLFLSTDPVAMDYYGLQVVDFNRRENRLPEAAFRAGYIQEAANILLGTNDPKKIDIRKI